MFLGCLWLFVYLAIRIPVYCQGGFDTGRIYGYPVQTPERYAASVVSVVDHFHIIESTSVDPYHPAHQHQNLYYPAPQGQNPFPPAPQAPQDHNQNTWRFFSRDPEFNNFLDLTSKDTEHFSIRMLDNSLMSITANFGDKHSPSPITRTLTLGPKLSKVVVSKWLHLFREVAEDKMLNKNLKKKWFNNAFEYLESLNEPDNKAKHDIRDLLKLLKRTKGSKHLYEELRSIKINTSKKSTNLLHQKKTEKKKIKVKKKYEDSSKKLKSKTNKRKIKDSKQKGNKIISKSDSLSDSESDKEPESESKNESEEKNSYDKEDKDYEDNADYDEYDSSKETSDKSNEESEESSDDNEYEDGDYDDIETDNYSVSEYSDSEESDSEDSDSHNDYNLDTSLFRMSKPGKPDKPDNGLSDYYLPEFYGKPMVTSSMIKEMEIQFKSDVEKFSLNLSGFPISNTTNEVTNTTLSKSLPTTLSKSLPTTPSSSITTQATQSSYLSTSSTTVSTSSKAFPTAIKEVSTSSKLVSTSGKAVPTSTIRGPESNAGFLAAQWKSRKHKVQGSKD